MNQSTSDVYTLDVALRDMGLLDDFYRLRVRMKESIIDGMELTGQEVTLILTALSHAAGVEKAFVRCFGELVGERGKNLCHTKTT